MDWALILLTALSVLGLGAGLLLLLTDNKPHRVLKPTTVLLIIKE